jgi:hypothetical protein
MLHWSMLAPPARRLADRRRKRRQLSREKLGLHRVELWLPSDVIAGLTRQMIVDRKITDEAALDPRSSGEATDLATLRALLNGVRCSTISFSWDSRAPLLRGWPCRCFATTSH